MCIRDSCTRHFFPMLGRYLLALQFVARATFLRDMAGLPAIYGKAYCEGCETRNAFAAITERIRCSCFEGPYLRCSAVWCTRTAHGSYQCQLCREFYCSGCKTNMSCTERGCEKMACCSDCQSIYGCAECYEYSPRASAFCETHVPLLRACYTDGGVRRLCEAHYDEK